MSGSDGAMRPLIPESNTSESTDTETIINNIRDNIVQIPDYQRDSDQWDDTTKSLLIESVINNLSIPAFFFEVVVDESGIVRSQVIDGQQRLTTLNEFRSNKLRLVKSQEAPYISPDSTHYAGKTFDELPPVYQHAFKSYRLTIIKLRDLRGLRLEVFRRINQGGTPLSGQDIRLAYYGENSPSLAFIRLVGVYDLNRQAALRFLKTAEEKFGIEYPWKELEARKNWVDLWEDKDLARGQTASEMFLWSLVAAQYDKLNDILHNPEALKKINVRYSNGIDEALDVYCAQIKYQDTHNDILPVLMPFEEMRTKFFPAFQAWFNQITTCGPSLDVRKHRTIAAVIGAAYRAGIMPDAIKRDTWTNIVKFIREPTKYKGTPWPQSKGRWEGQKGYRAQMEAASVIIRELIR